MPETYLADIIRPLVSKPEAIQISQSNDEMGLLLTLVVDKNDMGSVIGKQGETAKCIRHLLRIAGVKQNARISLKINEPDGSAYRPRRIQPEATSDRELLA